MCFTKVEGSTIRFPRRPTWALLWRPPGYHDPEHMTSTPPRGAGLIWIWGGLLLISSLGLIVFGGVPGKAADLFIEVLPTNPYFVPSHAPLLYLATPSVVLMAVFLFLSPGLAVVAALNAADSAAAWLIKGFSASLVMQAATSTVVKLAVDGKVDQRVFLAAGVALAIASLALLVWRVKEGKIRRWPLPDQRERRRAILFLATAAAVVIALLPIIFWQDLNDDGVEALEMGRSLSWFLVPRFLDGSGFIGLGIGMLPMAFPIHWFNVVFGPIEASARLPVALYVPALFAALIALIEVRAPRRLHVHEEGVLLLGVGLFLLVLGYNASYDNYFADLASPATFEVFTVFTLVAMFYGLWKGELFWFLLFASLAFTARPTGILFLGLIGVSVAVAAPAERWRAIRYVGAALGMFILVYVVYERWYYPWASASSVGYLSTGSSVNRFAYIQLDDIRRFAYWIVPCGIAPALAMFWFRKQDPLSRSLTIVTAGYFSVFYFPAFTNVHHFAPAMILPVVVYWRLALQQTDRRWTTSVALIGILVSVGLSLPGHFEVNRTMRKIGLTMAFRVGDYEGTAPEYRLSIQAQKALRILFGSEADVPDPSKEQVWGAHLWYYASKSQVTVADANYLVLPPGDPAPSPFTLLAQNDLAWIYVRDQDQLAADRFQTLRTDYRSPVYDIPREGLFWWMGVPAGHYDVHLAELLGDRLQ
jgi:hypothetical protein